jgi:hypothetical protein
LNRFYEYISSGTTPATAYNSVNPSTNSFFGTKGYLIRAPNNWSSSVASPYFGSFTGIPNNGEYFPTINLGYNLLGNPYPATIQASHFIGLNRTIETVYFWTHTTQAVGGIYPINNYASYTTLGGVAAAAGGQIPDGTIKIGQGFYVYSSENTNAWFHNALRYDVKNTQFFRNSNVVEKDIFRLNLMDATKAYNQILVGYTSEATKNFDLGVDGKAFNTENTMLYTLIDNKEYVIEGRPKFESNDVVPLGFKATAPGFYTISIENFEGVFNSNPIYLKDNLTQSLIDLKENSYSFLSESGTFNNRFELQYRKTNLNEISLEDVIVFSNDNEIVVHSNGSLIKKIAIYDVLGKKIIDVQVNNQDKVNIGSIVKNSQTLLLLITLENGSQIKRKIIF